MQVDGAELFGDEVEQVGLGETIDLRLKLEAVEDVLDVGREAVEIGAEIEGDVVLIADDRLQIHGRGVVEGTARGAHQKRIDAGGGS